MIRKNMSGVNWLCPHCNKNVVITEERFSIMNHLNEITTVDENHGISTEFYICPNPDCKKYTLKANLFKTRLKYAGYTDREIAGTAIKSWTLYPSSKAKVMPDYIPSQLVADYNEACEIKDLSPKASATLARRCLQGMIRDFWGVKEKNLFEEIKAIEEKVDPLTWAAIDAVRSIGNIGAHMEKDINLIIDVEPDEAEILLGLIETLFKDWYITRQERILQMEKIKKIAESKKEDKKKLKEQSDAK